MKKFSLLTFLGILALASLACTIFVGGPDYPADPIPVSPDLAQSLRDQIRQAVESAVTGSPVTFQINESQLTSYLSEKLAQDSTPLMTEPKVLLREGQMRVYGKIHQGILLANVAVIANVGVDVTGRPLIEILSADFGPLPAPEGLNSAISSLIEEAYTGSLGPVATGFRLESISIADGIMTLTGRVK